MNIIPCHEFVKSSISKAVLTCCNALVPYYLSKAFAIIEVESGGVDNITTTMKNKPMMLIYMKRVVF